MSLVFEKIQTLREAAKRSTSWLPSVALPLTNRAGDDGRRREIGGGEDGIGMGEIGMGEDGRCKSRWARLRRHRLGAPREARNGDNDCKLRVQSERSGLEVWSSHRRPRRLVDRPRNGGSLCETCERMSSRLGSPFA